ncbi:MAG: hypothetical protein WAV40_02095 [Microgenomates group bacterium]
MNSDEIALQIKKYKARKIKAKLAHYGTILSVFLGLSSFAQDFSLSSLYTFLLFSPVLLYFSLQSYKFAKKSRKIKLRLAQLETSAHSMYAKFSLLKFLSQPSFAFRLSLVLLFLIFFTTLARVRTETPQLSMSILSRVH